MVKKKVAFICVHNSCRSQIAEAFGKHFCCDVFECYSAGTSPSNEINSDAVRLMDEMYGLDLIKRGQFSKDFSKIPEVDMLISMGCNVSCPLSDKAFDEDWGIEDPTGKPDEEFKIIIKEILEKVLKLKRDIISSQGILK